MIFSTTASKTTHIKKNAGYFANFIGLFLLLASCFISSCQNKETADHTTTKPYFDLKGFFVHEIQTLNSKQARLNKTVWLNEREEKKSGMTALNWENELALFADADLNKAAFIGQYHTDTLPVAADTIGIVYTALKPDLRVQRAALYCSPDQKTVYRIDIKNKVRNPLYSSDEALYYIPQKEYGISNRQKVMWRKADSLSIKGVFLP